MITEKDFEEFPSKQREWRKGHMSAKTIEALELIRDKITYQKATPSIRTPGMSRPWDDQVEKLLSMVPPLRTIPICAAINKDENKLLFVLHASVLPPRVCASVNSCTNNATWHLLWSVLISYT